jgi:hypothetical protein
MDNSDANIEIIEEDNIKAVDLFNTISHEITRIYNNVKPTEINSDEYNIIKETINALQEGEETVLLRICTGKASEDEIEEWTVGQNIDKSEKDEIISMLQKSFTEGQDLAKNINMDINMDKNMDENMDNDKINIELEKVRDEIKRMSDMLSILNDKIDLVLNKL